MTTSVTPLDRARQKAYWRLLPLLFLCYVIAYVDRTNVSLAKLSMSKDLPAFDNAVIGFGAGVFFWGYFLLEVPGSLIVEKWGARKWICRIMVSWGICAALTALVKTPMHFYIVRFCLGLAEAGFFPGIVVYLTHWFPVRDRTRALALFFVATPVAQVVSPKISNALLKIGAPDEIVNGVTVHHPTILGMVGWQWLYIFWGIPAVLLGIIVFVWLKDRPRDAHWLTAEERDALEEQLAIEKGRGAKQRMTLFQALSHPKVLALSLAYFCAVTGTYGIEFFLPSILEQWYKLKLNNITWLVMLPPVLALVSQLFVGWSSDRRHERRWHAVIPLSLAVISLAIVPFTNGSLFATIFFFMIGFAGLKAYLPAFWAMPNMFLSGAAAAGSIGLINSVGNLGGFFGPAVLGGVQKLTGSFVGGIFYLSVSAAVAVGVIFFLGLGGKEGSDASAPERAAETGPSATPAKA